ncbi:MAG: DoxX family protein [Actinomycetota bacterium]|nr:DoxX family protein [Actinomycetota bacterium]
MSARGRAAMSAMNRFAAGVPLIVRVIVGVIMSYHGYQKLVGGIGAYSEGVLEPLGVPAPQLLGTLQVYAELIGGAMLVVGLLSRAAALVQAVILVLAIFLVKLDLGLIAPMGAPLPGAELDLALIAGFIVVALLGPGWPSLDHLFGIEKSIPLTVGRERVAREAS